MDFEKFTKIRDFLTLNDGETILKYDAFDDYVRARIDGLDVDIHNVHGNYASGEIDGMPCYIARFYDSYELAHNLSLAKEAAMSSALAGKTMGERIKLVHDRYELDEEISAHELYKLHGYLTGSCIPGRRKFMARRMLAMNYGAYTMRQFIHIAWNEDKNENVRRLAKLYGYEV